MKNKYLEKILCDRKQIQTAIKESVKWANQNLKGNRTNVVVLGILSGSIPFFGQLLPQLRFSLITDFIRVDTYMGAASASQEPMITQGMQESTKKYLKNKTVLVVDDIMRTGKTAQLVYDELMRLGAKEVIFMFLFNQEVPKVKDISFKYHTAIDIPDEFLVGFGLDYQGKYRNLDCVGTLKEKYLKK